MDARLALYEPIEFIHAFLMDRLRFDKRPETVAIHAPCSTEKMGLTAKMKAVAQEYQSIVHRVDRCTSPARR